MENQIWRCIGSSIHYPTGDICLGGAFCGYGSGIWRRDMQQGYGTGIWRKDMQQGYAAGICSRDMQPPADGGGLCAIKNYSKLWKHHRGCITISTAARDITTELVMQSDVTGLSPLDGPDSSIACALASIT